MRPIPGLLYLAVVMAGSTPPAYGQLYIPAGLDHVTYDPHVPGTSAGRLYVGD